ncbi:hypothetical protein [Hyphomicrobium sp.]|jgi:hypothetical protein|uniref:hypothetical protein n=1 Tax=Hyphomicrobium sp. TaxID=82 RepID=UPI002C7BE70C|nr:hypothetical protein [Hyphomicrobium sp.]HVZ04419.1 hypothetical protein [Hyphomicrobium sp.]
MSAAALGTKGKASTPIPTGVPPTGRRLASAARLTPQDPEAARTVVFSIIARIESYLDEETAALSKSLEFDFKSSNDRKNQGLLDLNQAMRRLQRSDVNSDLQMRLVAFREKLAVNLRRIRLHLDAVREIAAMLSEAIQSAESDGTYTRNIGPYGNLP